MSDLQHELDRYVDAIAAATGGPTPGLRAGRPADQVRQQLGLWSIEPVQELVDLWTWRDGENETFAGLFWGGPFHNLERVLAEIGAHRENLEEHRYIISAEGIDFQADPAEIVPVLYAGRDITFVDSGPTSNTRGHVFHLSTEEPLAPIDMFASLTDAVRAARYCVEAQYWIPEAQARFMDAPLRAGGVSQQDITSPPFRMKPSVD